MGRRCVRRLGKEGRYQVAIGELEEDKAERKGITIWGLADGGN